MVLKVRPVGFTSHGIAHANNSSYKNIQIHVQYKIVIRVINIIISYFLVNGWKPYFLVHSLVFIFFVIFA